MTKYKKSIVIKLANIIEVTKTTNIFVSYLYFYNDSKPLKREFFVSLNGDSVYKERINWHYNFNLSELN